MAYTYLFRVTHVKIIINNENNKRNFSFFFFENKLYSNIYL